jgi:hypothetical protein
MEKNGIRHEKQRDHARGKDQDMVRCGGEKQLEWRLRRKKSEEKGAEKVGYPQNYDQDDWSWWNMLVSAVTQNNPQRCESDQDVSQTPGYAKIPGRLPRAISSRKTAPITLKICRPTSHFCDSL